MTQRNAKDHRKVPPRILPANTQETGMNVPKGKGSFATHSFTLKKTKWHHKYGCKLCKEVLDSAHLLTVHHQ